MAEPLEPCANFVRNVDTIASSGADSRPNVADRGQCRLLRHQPAIRSNRMMEVR
jgi:hypothetical protein